MSNIEAGKEAILVREGNNIFDVLGISPNLSKEDIAHSALLYYEGGSPISTDEWNIVSNDLAILGVDWAPKPIINIRVTEKMTRESVNFSIFKKIAAKVYRKRQL